jgi:twitching motility protein PilT
MPADAKGFIYSVLNDNQIIHFETQKELDFSIYLEGVGRIRANIYLARGNVEAAFRIIPLKIESFEELGLPSVLVKMCQKRSGLVVVTGPTGSGKTTTLAAMINYINTNYSCRLITIEDPIEYVHFHKKSMVIQREVYTDTPSFRSALIHTLRQDPNVICVGEMRDLETIATVLTAAETGHLVLTTLHTPDTAQTINRIIDVFPPHQQTQVAIQLAGCLEGIVAQLLLPLKDKPGRVIATEVLFNNSAVRNIIRDRRIDQLSSVIQTGAGHGMHSMDASLVELYKKGLISYEVALATVSDPHQLSGIQ